MFAVALNATLVIEKGATLAHVLTVYTGEPPSVVNLTGCEAQMLVKPAYGSATTFADFSTENGALLINGAAGTITFDVTREETAAMAWTEGVHNLYLDWPNEETWVLLEGPAFVKVGTR